MRPHRLLAAITATVFLGLGLLWITTARRSQATTTALLPTGIAHQPQAATSAVSPPAAIVTGPTPLQLILAPQPAASTTALDQEIVRQQNMIRRPDQPAEMRLAAVEKLGWLFVAQAGAQDDDGCYKLAEQCALVMAAEQPDSPDAMLLRGHVLHQFHRFKEAEALARQLVAVRNLPYDYGLLGDSLMEQGRLADAIPAYQAMLNLKPGFESFVRAAHMRWLKGNLPGAQALMVQVLGMIHPREKATAAWAEARMASYDFQAGNFPSARQHAEIALQAKPTNAPAHLVLARVLASEGRGDEALTHFRAAAQARPLPEFLWALADELEARQLTAEAAPVEQTLRQIGRRSDPRGLALYLATTRQDPAEALHLAQAEMENRQDVFTWDALAWSQYASGQIAPAHESMQHALAEGTQDGRLFLHAAVIAAAAGDESGKLDFTRKADALKQTLLPSERRFLDGLDAPADLHAAR